ncbi:MAG: RDD family protein [Bacteroidia bacterium]
MTQTPDKVTKGLRLGSMIIDHFAMSFISAFIMIPAIAIVMFMDKGISPSASPFSFTGTYILFALAYSTYFNKDIFNGRGPAKRMLNMQVIDNKTNKAASPLKCLLRNITLPLWPIELIFVLINPKRRLGDKIAGTRIDYVTNPENAKLNWGKIALALLIAAGILGIIFQAVLSWSPTWQTDDVAFVKGSQNESLSKEANQVFETQTDGIIKKANFIVFDQIENSEKRLVVGNLYFNRRKDFDDFENSERKLKTLLLSTFPLTDHVCSLTYIYKESGREYNHRREYIED